MAKRKKKSSSGFLFMFIIIAILGLIVFFYRDNFLVFMNTTFNSGKEFVDKKVKNNNINGFFEKIPFFKNKNEDKRNIVKDKIILNEQKNKNNEISMIDKEEEKIILKGNNKTDKKQDPQKKETIKNKSRFLNKNEIQKKEYSKDNISKNENIKSETKEKQNKILIKKNGKEESESIRNKDFKVFFSRINNDEKLVLTPVSRNIIYTDSPLTETIKVLLIGPSSNEKGKEIITNIPDNSKIISITIKDNIAYINFSKEFEYNKYGRESTLNQLKQIVFTATEFPSVKKVQFLIEGKIKNYLGGEGVVIDKPLSRNDFS